MNSNKLLIIKSFINENKYKVEIDKNEIKIAPINSVTNSDYCILFTINIDKINIGPIKKCIDLSGNQIIELVENIARELNIFKITLDDVSQLNIINEHENKCTFDLALISILTSGMSWYNKLGYRSNNFTNEFEHNSKIINMTLTDFLNFGLIKKKKKFTAQFKYSILNGNTEDFPEMNKIKKQILSEYNPNIHLNKREFIKKYIDGYIILEHQNIQIEFNEILNLIRENNITKTVKQFMNDFKQKMRNRHIICRSDEVKIIFYIINMSSYLIKYSLGLHKNL